MGCDIHAFLEYKNNDGVWEDANIFEFDNYDQAFQIMDVYDGRDYELFAVLANVRNDNGNRPISEPRGVPDDVSGNIKEEIKKWDCDGHSHSYYTLRELLDYTKPKKKLKRAGFMTPENADKVDAGGQPNEWWQSGNIPNQQYREWERPDNSIREFISQIKQHWKIKHKYCDDEDINKIADRIRIVFFFDN